MLKFSDVSNNLECGIDCAEICGFDSIRRVIPISRRSFLRLTYTFWTFDFSPSIKVLKKNKLIYICAHFTRFSIKLNNNIQN